MTPAEASAVRRDAAGLIVAQDEQFMALLLQVGGRRNSRRGVESSRECRENTCFSALGLTLSLPCTTLSVLRSAAAAASLLLQVKEKLAAKGVSEEVQAYAADVLVQVRRWCTLLSSTVQCCAVESAMRMWMCCLAASVPAG